jgi:glyoxylase-like metal-dependent hydrolase (beta-lactamase superfamily II)
MLQKDGTMRQVMARTLPGWTREEVNFVLSEPLVMPEIIFNNKMSLFLGDVTLRLFHLGGHTEGSICVYVEEDKVLLTGDNVSADQHPFRGHANSALWIKALRWMKDLETEVIIPGHGEVCQKDELDRMMEYLVRLSNITEDLIKKGVEREGVLKKIHHMMINYYKIEPDLLEVTSWLFDLGTLRLYDEILAYY